MTSQIIAQLTTSIVSILGVVTTSIITIRAHTQVTQSVIASNPATQTTDLPAQKLR